MSHMTCKHERRVVGVPSHPFAVHRSDSTKCDETIVELAKRKNGGDFFDLSLNPAERLLFNIFGKQSDHYAYCHSSVCPGCLPSDEELQGWHRLALWGEMLARCIDQTPDTKTYEGALEAIRAEDDSYRAMAFKTRMKPDWLTPEGRLGRRVCAECNRGMSMVDGNLCEVCRDAL